MQIQQPKNNIIIDNLKPHPGVVNQNFPKELQSVRLSGRKLQIYESNNKNNIFQINEPLIYKSVQSDYFSDTYQEAYCGAIAFNTESTVMIAGSKELIQVFDFKLGKLKRTKQLRGHQGTVTTLYFMESNEIISGSADSNILIWGFNNNQQWYCKQQLTNGHTKGVSCVIMNTNEYLIISCGYDNSIKLWEKRNEWECSQTLSCDTYVSNSLSLNHSQNQLVSWGKDKQILIFQVTKNKQWKKIQRIQVANSEARVFFIGDNLAYHPEGEKMEIFELDVLTKLFIQSKEANVENNFFSLQLYFEIWGGDILETKTAYLMRKQNQYDFKARFFDTWGALTDNAEYLMTRSPYYSEYLVLKLQK